MDNQRFDALAQRLAVLSSRREGLRVLLAGLAAAVAGVSNALDAAACRRRGELCTKNGQCCSGGCGNQRRRKLKKKNGEIVRKLVGRCACSLTRERCKIAKDCCDEQDVCGPNDCDEGSVCCKPIGFPCRDSCDCCFDALCGDESGLCERKDCQLTLESCESTDDCCFEEDECGGVDEDCETQGDGDRFCCGKTGSPCDPENGDCDCCFPLLCDPDLEECVAPSSLCPPDEVVCTSPNRIKDCCDEDAPHCCDEGAVAGCCGPQGFSECCNHEREVVIDGQTVKIGCCHETQKCCESTDKELCCPADQVCCPAVSSVPCASSLEACGPS